MTDILFKELALKIYRYFMVTKIEHLLKRYLLILDELIYHMREHFGVYIILEKNVDFSDLIEEA